MSEVDAYVAGFFDGEGTLNVHAAFGQKGGQCFRIAIYQNDKEVLKWIRTFFGGNIHEDKCSRLEIYGAQSIKFLQAIRPYTMVKNTQIDTYMACWETRKDREACSNLWKNRPWKRGAIL